MVNCGLFLAIFAEPRELWRPVSTVSLLSRRLILVFGVEQD